MLTVPQFKIESSPPGPESVVTTPPIPAPHLVVVAPPVQVMLELPSNVNVDEYGTLIPAYPAAPLKFNEGALILIFTLVFSPNVIELASLVGLILMVFPTKLITVFV
ncbi:MAG: hypothetical protein LBD63_03070 [Mycoplasmataceae bacterium]|nr:hypothetical protein [Mycoplasmataceae bacterium]